MDAVFEVKGGFTMNRRGNHKVTSHQSPVTNLVFWCSGALVSLAFLLTLTLAQAQELPYSITDITSGEAVDFYPEFSRDGKKIVFSSKPLDGSYFDDMHLWIMDADGNNRRQITSKSAMYLQPTFTPDGERVVFISNLEDGLWDVWSMKINGSGLTRLTKDNQKEFFPIVTADGKNIIFIGRYFGTDSVFIMDTDGKNLKRLTSGGNGDSFPAICQDGKDVIFSTTRLGNSNLWTVDREGKIYNRLTYEDTIEFSPSCSPDGRRIAYVAIEGGAKTYSKARKGFEFKEISYRERSFDMWLMNRDGSGRRQIAKNIFETGPSMRLFKSVDVIEGINYYHISWHPDGKKLALSRWNKDRPGSRISIMSLDNDAVERLPIGETAVSEYSLIREKDLTGGNWDDITPSFAPDGNSIVFASNRTGGWNIWSMDGGGENLRQITKDDDDELAPVYSPDGKEIAFLKKTEPLNLSTSDSFDIWIMKSDGSGARQVTNGISILSYPAWKPDGKEIVFVSEGSEQAPEIWGYDIAEGSLKNIITIKEASLLAFKLNDATKINLINDRRYTNTPNPISIGAGGIYPYNKFLYRISYSPRGDKITFELDMKEKIGIWTINSDGNGLTPLVKEDSLYWTPVFSPDGKKIAYSKKAGKQFAPIYWTDYNIWIADVDSGEKMMINGEEQIDWYPSWSPDGKKIVYVTNRSGDFSRFNIWLLYLK
jgi:TolB protein